MVLQQNCHTQDNQNNKTKKALTTIAPLVLGVAAGRLAYKAQCSGFGIMYAISTPSILMNINKQLENPEL